MTCPTCNGQGWLMDSEGEPCPDCQNPAIIGGTGIQGGELTPELKAMARIAEQTAGSRKKIE